MAHEYETNSRAGQHNSSAPSPEAFEQWEREGLLHWVDFISDTERLQSETLALQQAPETPGKWMKYFEEAPTTGNRTLCRVENFATYSAYWRTLVSDDRLLALINRLFGEPACLYKEKINFKLSGSGGFTAHQDAPAFCSFIDSIFITVMLVIDAADESNGALEYSPGSHRKGLLPQTADKTLPSSVESSLPWRYVIARPGDVVLFNSLLAHRSRANLSETSRRAGFITFNPASAGDHRHAYFAAKRAAFPPDCERQPGVKYVDSAGVFNVGNPISTRSDS